MAGENTIAGKSLPIDRRPSAGADPQCQKMSKSTEIFLRSVTHSSENEMLDTKTLLCPIKGVVKTCSFVGFFPFDCDWKNDWATGKSVASVRRNRIRHLPMLVILCALACLFALSARGATAMGEIIKSYPNYEASQLSESWCPQMFAIVVTLPVLITCWGFVHLALAYSDFGELLEAMAQFRLKEHQFRKIRYLVSLKSGVTTTIGLLILVGVGLILRQLASAGFSDAMETMYTACPHWITALATFCLTVPDAVLLVFLQTISQAMEVLNDDLSHCLESFRTVSRGDGNSPSGKSERVGKKFVKEMEAIRVRYICLCQMVDKVSECFSSYLLVTLSSTILLLVATSFVAMITMMEARQIGESLFTTYNIYVFFWFWLRVCYICYAGSRPANAVSQAQGQLSLTEDLLIPDECNNKLLTEVEGSIISQFQNQLRINNPQMNAKGFIDISLGLILEVLAGIGNYVVIIIQFQPTDDGGGYTAPNFLKALACHGLWSSTSNVSYTGFSNDTICLS